jgi:hypothetical protein
VPDLDYVHDPLCGPGFGPGSNLKLTSCICPPLYTARTQERAKILKDSEDGTAYRKGLQDAADKIKTTANELPRGPEFDLIWVALSSAVDSIERMAETNEYKKLS